MGFEHLKVDLAIVSDLITPDTFILTKEGSIKEKIEKRKKMFGKVYAAHEKGLHWMISTGSFPVFETKQEGQCVS